MRALSDRDRAEMRAEGYAGDFSSESIRDWVEDAKYLSQEQLEALQRKRAQRPSVEQRELVELLTAGSTVAANKVESPVEDVFLTALIECGFNTTEGGLEGRFGTLRQQYIVETEARYFRLDFAVIRHVGPYVVQVDVEVDGHAFHERTREQAQKDKSRDRILALYGWVTMRFTGAEVKKNPGGCALEVAGVVVEWVNRLSGGR